MKLSQFEKDLLQFALLVLSISLFTWNFLRACSGAQPLTFWTTFCLCANAVGIIKVIRW